jgi:hypothetical protein
LSRDRDTATAGVKAKPSGGPRPALTPAQPGEREEREERVDPTRQQADHQQRVSSSPPRRSHGRGKPVVPSPWQATRSRPPLSPLAAVADDTVDLSDGSSSIPLRARSSHSGRADRPQLGRSSGLSRTFGWAIGASIACPPRCEPAPGLHSTTRDTDHLVGQLLKRLMCRVTSDFVPPRPTGSLPTDRLCPTLPRRGDVGDRTQPPLPVAALERGATRSASLRVDAQPDSAVAAHSTDRSIRAMPVRSKGRPPCDERMNSSGNRGPAQPHWRPTLGSVPGWPSTTRSMKGGPRTVRPNGSRVLDRH